MSVTTGADTSRPRFLEPSATAPIKRRGGMEVLMRGGCK